MVHYNSQSLSMLQMPASGIGYGGHPVALHQSAFGKMVLGYLPYGFGQRRNIGLAPF
jgi:hypothetical protein